MHACPLYIEYENLYYSLQSSTLRNDINRHPDSKTLPGHAFPIFRCDDRYFSPDCRMIRGTEEYRSFGDINLIESMLNDGEITAVNETEISMKLGMKYSCWERS